MSSTIERRLRRLEQEAGAMNGGALIEHELSDEAKDLMRDALGLLGRLSPEEIEAKVNGKHRVPRHFELSPEASALLDEARERLQQPAPTW